MRTRRTPAPHTSRPRATRLRGLVAALLAAPLALGTLAATALPAAAEPWGGQVAYDSPVVVGKDLPILITCPDDEMLPSVGAIWEITGGRHGEAVFARSNDSTKNYSATVVFDAVGDQELMVTCELAEGGSIQFPTYVDVEPAPLVVEDTTTAIRFFPAAVEPRNPISVEAKVVGTAGIAQGGSVQFSLRGQAVGSPVPLQSNGYAVTDIPNPGPGSWAVTATYSGTELYKSSTETKNVWVKTTSIVTAAIPDRVRAPQTTLHAAVVQAPDFPAPTGTITFRYSEGAILGKVQLVNSTAVLQLPDLAPGVYEDVIAIYSGDENYGDGGSAYRDMIVDPPIPTTPVKNASAVTVGVPLAITGTQVPVTVKVEPGMHETSMGATSVATPSGTVAITLGKGGPRQKVTLVDGTASVVFDGVATGTYEVEASYAGDQYFEVGYGYAPTTVTAPVVTPPVVTPPAAPAPDLSGSTSTLPVGGTITLVARDFLPGETVSFYLHSDPIFLGTAVADANGVATLVVAIPAGAPTGEHHVRATGATSLRTAEIPVTVTAAPVVTAPIVTVPVAVPVVTPVAAAPVAAAAPAAAAPLASTGAELGSTVLLVTVLLGSGALLLAGRRRFASLAG